MEHQVHFGRKFYQDKKTGYWISCDYPRIRAHRWVWIKTHGIIPVGYHIHHIDENKSNNSVENLELIHFRRHRHHHMSKISDITKEKMRKNLDNIRPLSKKWHSSAEGILWHKKHGIEVWLNKKEIVKNCLQCKSQFSTKTYHQEFCSNSCKSNCRRKSKIDNIEKICVCGKNFSTNKYSKTIFCSKKCRYYLPTEVKEKIIEFFRSGKSKLEISKLMGINRNRVSAICKKTELNF